MTIEFSSTLQPFNAGTTPAEYVRVRAQNFTMPAWLIPVVGRNNKVVGASAVAGPSPTILQACDLVPLVVCGRRLRVALLRTGDISRGSRDVLKSAAGQGSVVGPGNFQLLRLGGSGANVLRQNLAGGYEGCYDGSGTILPNRAIRWVRYSRASTRGSTSTRVRSAAPGNLSARRRHPPDHAAPELQQHHRADHAGRPDDFQCVAAGLQLQRLSGSRAERQLRRAARASWPRRIRAPDHAGADCRLFDHPKRPVRHTDSRRRLLLPVAGSLGHRQQRQYLRRVRRRLPGRRDAGRGTEQYRGSAHRPVVPQLPEQ